MTYLADTSAWTNFHKSAETERRWTQLVVDDQIAICEPVKLELLRSARGYAEFTNVNTMLDAIRPAPIEQDVWKRALEVFDRLASRGHHRGVSMVDLLVAAAAERWDDIILHYDQDFDLIADVTNQPMEWIAPRGTL